MRTRKELIPFTLEELQRMAKDEGIDVLGRNKMGIISELLIKDKSPKPIIEEASLEEIPDPVYTDRGGKQIFREETVNCRVGGKWFPGVISRFKKIEDDDYAFVLLDGAEKTKMFHTIDLEKTSKTKKVSAPKIVPESIKKIAEDLNKINETIKIEIPIVIDKKVEKIVSPTIKKEEEKIETPESPKTLAIEEKCDTFKHLHGNTRILLMELHKIFNDNQISRNDKILRELKKKFYISNFAQTLNIWVQRNLCVVHNNEHGKMDTFKLTI